MAKVQSKTPTSTLGTLLAPAPSVDGLPITIVKTIKVVAHILNHRSSSNCDVHLREDSNNRGEMLREC